MVLWLGKLLKHRQIFYEFWHLVLQLSGWSLVCFTQIEITGNCDLWKFLDPLVLMFLPAQGIGDL